MTLVDYQEAKDLLFSLYQRILGNKTADVKRTLKDNAGTLDIIYSSKTQSYREVLLGCALIHLLAPEANIRLPYVNHGEGSFNGRSLDEYVVNPFLQEQLFPCSRGPYLAAFRRSVKLLPETSEGLRDKTGYAAMMDLLSVLENCDTKKKTETFIMCLLQRFVMLRDESKIPLARIGQLSVGQYGQLLSKLVRHQSGGLLPVLIALAFFQTLAEHYSLPWEISWQGINVADNATGAEGDISIKTNGVTVLAIEITERPIDQRRIVSTFNTKIILSDIKDYLFLYTNIEPDESAKQIVHNLFSQGYNINFANVVEMITNNFVVLPSSTRNIFSAKMISLLESRDVSASVKLKWNESVKAVVHT